MEVRVKYFAKFREMSGIESEFIETSSSDVAGLIKELGLKHPFLSQQKNILVAINESFADFASPIREGDLIAFLPPVSGG